MEDDVASLKQAQTLVGGRFATSPTARSHVASTGLARGWILPLRAARRLPPWLCYLLTAGVVLLCFAARWSMRDAQPYLVFLPGIALAAAVFDRGAGFLAAFLSAALELLLSAETRPGGSLFSAEAVGWTLAFAGIGVFLSALIEGFRNSAELATDAHLRLTQRAALLQSIIEAISEPLCVRSLDHRFIYMNSAFARLLSAPRDAAIGRFAAEFFPPETAALFDARDREVIESQHPMFAEERLQGPGDAGAKWFLTTRYPWRDDAAARKGVVAIWRDDDVRKRAQEAAEISSAQKELLLRDINHRIKNHLHSLIGMLTMDKRRLANEAAKDALQTAIKRLTVLARLYDKLQVRGAAGAAIDLSAYLESICKDLESTIIGTRPIVLRVASEALEMESECALALGLLLNEALTNVIKHAYGDQKGGAVAVRFFRRDDRCVLEIADDGRGLDTDGAPAGLGSSLMRALAQQLRGEISWLDADPGTIVRVEFPAPSPRPAPGPLTAI
jgi:PAS domain S-box-containing protein